MRASLVGQLKVGIVLEDDEQLARLCSIVFFQTFIVRIVLHHLLLDLVRQATYMRVTLACVQ